MFVIKVNIRRFNYFLRFDYKYEEAFAEGLINNATKLSKEKADELISCFKSIWPLKIITYG